MPSRKKVNSKILIKKVKVATAIPVASEEPRDPEENEIEGDAESLAKIPNDGSLKNGNKISNVKMSFSDEETTKLIEFVGEHDFLYDINHEDHKDTKKADLLFSKFVKDNNWEGQISGEVIK